MFVIEEEEWNIAVQIFLTKIKVLGYGNTYSDSLK